MAQVSNHVEHNRIDELADRDMIARQYGADSESTRVALLELRHADWEVIKCLQVGAEPDPSLVEAARLQRERVAAIGGPMVDYYGRIIAGAAAKMI